jgi:hypothetical protein
MTLALAIVGTVLGILNLFWNVWTWRGSNSRIRVETAFHVFPGVVFGQMMNQLAQTQLPLGAEQAAQQIIQQHSHLTIPAHLGFPASPELMAVVPPETVMVVATITNTGRLPVTVQRCQWQTSQPGLIETPNTSPGVAFPYRLSENDQCISVASLATIMSLLDVPLRNQSLTMREAWPLVSVANRKKPVRGNRLTIPVRSLPAEGQSAGPDSEGS